MNLAKCIKTINNECKKEHIDVDLMYTLRAIAEEFFQDGYNDTNSVEIDGIYFQDRPWNDSDYTYKQRHEFQKKAIKQLEEICVKLRKYGFKAKPHSHRSDPGKKDNVYFGTPFIWVTI